VIQVLLALKEHLVLLAQRAQQDRKVYGQQQNRFLLKLQMKVTLGLILIQAEYLFIMMDTGTRQAQLLSVQQALQV
jgi:hypothetical protein